MSIIPYQMSMESSVSRTKGSNAESHACEFLLHKGFEIIERNFYTRYGEIDIIARKDNVLHFIEVKSGSSFEPIYNITPAKLTKLTKSIKIYLAKNKTRYAFCLDALIIRYENGIPKECELVENITL